MDTDSKTDLLELAKAVLDENDQGTYTVPAALPDRLVLIT